MNPGACTGKQAKIEGIPRKEIIIEKGTNQAV